MNKKEKKAILHLIFNLKDVQAVNDHARAKYGAYLNFLYNIDFISADEYAKLIYGHESTNKIFNDILKRNNLKIIDIL